MKKILAACICLLAWQTASTAQTTVYSWSNRQFSTEHFGMPGSGWAECDSVWYYYGFATNLGPDTYTKISRIPKMELVRKTKPGKPERIGLEQTQTTRTVEQRLCTYSTDEPGWKWNGDNWLFEGKKAKAFPPVFTAHRRTTIVVTTTESGISRTDTTRSEPAAVRYVIAERGWKWNPARRRWLWHGYEKGFPPYEPRAKQQEQP